MAFATEYDVKPSTGIQAVLQNKNNKQHTYSELMKIIINAETVQTIFLIICLKKIFPMACEFLSSYVLVEEQKQQAFYQCCSLSKIAKTHKFNSYYQLH